MKNLTIAFLLSCSFSALALDTIKAVSDNAVTAYLCPLKDQKLTAAETCRKQAPIYQQFLKEEMETKKIDGSVMVAGVVERTTEGPNCYLIIQVESETHKLTKKTDVTPSVFTKEARANNFAAIFGVIAARPGYTLLTNRFSDGGCDESKALDRLKFGNLIDSFYLVQK